MENCEAGSATGFCVGTIAVYHVHNDLLMIVTRAISFADDTSVMVTGKDYTSFKQKTSLALTSLEQWFITNQLVLNITKTNVIKFTPKTTVHVPLDICFKDKNVLDEVNSTKFLGILYT
jgi:hypothetical protein